MPRFSILPMAKFQYLAAHHSFFKSWGLSRQRLDFTIFSTYFEKRKFQCYLNYSSILQTEPEQ